MRGFLPNYQILNAASAKLICRRLNAIALAASGNSTEILASLVSSSSSLNIQREIYLRMLLHSNQKVHSKH